jgi:DNA-binding transcriptional MerR regulator
MPCPAEPRAISCGEFLRGGATVSPSSEASPDNATPATDVEWPITIAELATRVGMTIRNIRAHQSRGLLPAPIRQGRVACYGLEHETVLVRIKALQARGYNLAAIEELLRGGADEHAALHRLMLAPLVGRDEVTLTWREIAGMFGQEPDADRYRRAVESGLVQPTGDGDLIAPSESLLRAARELVDRGVPFHELFDMQVEVAGETRDIARRFVELCLRCALEPYGADDVPPHQWDDVQARFEDLYQRMTSVLGASFAVSVRRAAEALLADREGA